MQIEMLFLHAAILAYLAASGVVIASAIAGKARDQAVFLLLTVALMLHTGSIALRWQRLDHGPYVDLFEILSSNVWSLHLILLLATVRFRMVLGKVFLGLVVVAVGLCLIVVARRAFGWRLDHAPASDQAEILAHRVMLVAVVFQTLMLVAGAAWARDAWGRYWAWDPLESWAFLTWVAMLAYLHWRPRNQAATTVNAALVIGIYIIAFATFFGVPFISLAPHKGAI
jgi:ABC-type transport system involved in cytochrome c biogenesis permease subunit